MSRQRAIRSYLTRAGASSSFIAGAVLALLCAPVDGLAGVIFETWSPYHHIQVLEQAGYRILSFDGSMESRVSTTDPLKGHFEYTEYFHLAWVWNAQIQSVLMIGLGGGSSQRLFRHYYPELQIHTVEIDPKVVDVAKQFFSVVEDDKHRIFVEDGRMFLIRTTDRYDLIILDAYTANRYGSSLPYHLVTQEFFRLASSRLTDAGVLAYNVIGTMSGYQSRIVAAVARTLKAVFPNVYFFPAQESQNVVLIATKSGPLMNCDQIVRRAAELIVTRKQHFPYLVQRATRCWTKGLETLPQAPILTDDRAPLDGLLPVGR